MSAKHAKSVRPAAVPVAFVEAMEDRRLYSVSQSTELSTEPPPEPPPQEPEVVEFLSGLSKAIKGVAKSVAPLARK